MRCKLDTIKAMELRGVINDCSYAFKYDLDKYYELCTIMDRYEDTVEYLNSVELPCQQNQFNATDFIMWVNYADLLVICIKTLNDIFVVPNGTTFFQNRNIKINSKVKGKLKRFFNAKQSTDDEYFRFIRSMVLAHSLKIDAYKQFTHGLTAYSPLVRWNNKHDIVEITYYVADRNVETRTIEIEVKNVISYLEDRCSYLDDIFKYIRLENEKAKESIKKKYVEDFFSLPSDRIDKIKAIENVHIKNGDIDIKNESSIVLTRLKQIMDCLTYSFDSINNYKIAVFEELVDFTLEDLVNYLKQQRDDFLLNDILCGCAYENTNSLFSHNVYEINKIVSEYCDTEQTNWFGFNQWFDKITDIVNQYIVVIDTMSNLEKAFLCMIAMVFDLVLTTKEIKDRFPKELIKKVECLYEIQV